MKYLCSLFCSYYKGSKFIEGYIENILEQPLFKNIQFIFLDCASPEDEKKHILPLLSRYSNIEYHALETDPGLYAAWNIAIGLCSADIIGNWNIDDRKNQDGLQVLLQKLAQDPNRDLVYGLTYVSKIANERYVDNPMTSISPWSPHSVENLINNNSPHCMPLWKKSLHDRYGYFDEKYLTAADGDLWLRCAIAGGILHAVFHPVGLYYENPTGRSTNPATMKTMLKEVYDMRKSHILSNPALFARSHTQSEKI